MGAKFREFSGLFERLVEKYPDHPLIPQLRSSIAGLRRPPSEQWLDEKIQRIEKILSQHWLEDDNTSESDAIDSSVA
jgi:hypothetical protein